MAKTQKMQDALPPIDEDVTVFEVDSTGTLSMVGIYVPETRAGFYEEVADAWGGSPQALADAMKDCQPLAWEVHTIYTNLRNELSAALLEAQQAGSAHKKRRSALQARLRTMPEEPEDGVDAWLLGLTTREFNETVAPKIVQWFDSPPDWTFEDDYLPQDATAQGAAMEFFQMMDTAERKTLGVRVVEGEHPGSSYYAAEFRGDVEGANRAAREAGIAVRFVRVGGIER